MTSLLLAVTYLTFVSLGLPDALLGSAWPVMHSDLGAPVAAQSAISIIVSACTIVSSLLTARLVRRLGTGRLCALSVALTAAAMLGFSFTRSLWQLCLLAVPYGLGAGAIDAALNNYAALNFGARHMSWLHCCWGIGASAGPVAMGWALATPASWTAGYLDIGAVQVAIAVVLFISLPLWQRTGADAPGGAGSAQVEGEPADGPAAPPTARGLLRLPGAAAAVGSFGFYCALEGSTGLWTASYLVMARGVEAPVAASIVSLFFLGITAGRFVSGALAHLLSSERQIVGGLAICAAGLAMLVFLPAGPAAWVAVGIMGFGCAPVYPSIVALTPGRFGGRASQGLVSLQMACGYAGSSLVPPLFGLVAGAGGAAAIPWMLAVILAADLACARVAQAKARPAA